MAGSTENLGYAIAGTPEREAGHVKPPAPVTSSQEPIVNSFGEDQETNLGQSQHESGGNRQEFDRGRGKEKESEENAPEELEGAGEGAAGAGAAGAAEGGEAVEALGLLAL
jgi:hypothetical protein